MTDHQFKDFNASTVPLQDTNLIEASAGTGKTYSIAILTLRLVLEKRLGINQVLMVTFTKAAVAELEERIRLFIRLAHQYAQGQPIGDDTIAAIVDASIDTNDEGRQGVLGLLKDAQLFLDETSVLTIHSFCQLTLSEFAFETGQTFGADLMQDSSLLTGQEINKFWRAEVTILPAYLLNWLFLAGFSRGDVNKVVKEFLGGKKLKDYNPLDSYQLESEVDPLIQALKELDVKVEAELSGICGSLEANKAEIAEKCSKNRYASQSLLPYLGDMRLFLSVLWGIKEKKYATTLFGDILEAYQIVADLKERQESMVSQFRNKLYMRAIARVSRSLAREKKHSNKLSFDDLIVNLHAALVGRENHTLIQALRDKYKAVFIDEFQDTDKLQYEIFEKAFGVDTILFYIGDPKQSIYAWRKADIFTYFKAAETVTNRYSMNVNFRSSTAMIAGMNEFFQPRDSFDTFCFAGQSNKIEYIKVESPSGNRKGFLQYGGSALKALSISRQPNKEDLLNAAVGQVIQLLSDEKFRIEDAKGSRAIRLSDIGVLVRSHSHATAIKSLFDKYRIPSVSINDARILKSEEAPMVLFLLEAMVNTTRSNISRALLSPITGLCASDILRMDETVVLTSFQHYQLIMERSGVYAAMTAFVHDFGIQHYLLSPATPYGERRLTNFYQLTELLHKMQNLRKFSAAELVNWLQRGIEGDERNEGDEFVQRIESDEESIKIVTIHKSKGLEYNIVIAPFLDFESEARDEYVSYRDADSGEYLVAAKSSLGDDLLSEIRQQAEQENRRLLYVAITRAVYKCYVFKNDYFKNSTLSAFLDEFGEEHQQIEFIDAVAAPAGYYYRQEHLRHPAREKIIAEFRLNERNWRKMSYSMLSKAHIAAGLPIAMNQEDAYDQFIFSKLGRGAKTGNLLHHIFENIRFNHAQGWGRVIEQALHKHAPGSEESFAASLMQLLEHVLNTSLNIGEHQFSLSEIPQEHQMHELEFDFRVSPFNVRQLEQLSVPGREVHVGDLYQLEGVMNGKIDMFFEHGGRYYVLDWKSNYLGDTLADYATARVAQAMDDSNYHLQYLIYTLAVSKYLASRIANFNYDSHFGGVIYLFVRGVRRDADTGIFLTRPLKQDIAWLDELLTSDGEIS